MCLLPVGFTEITVNPLESQHTGCYGAVSEFPCLYNSIQQGPSLCNRFSDKEFQTYLYQPVSPSMILHYRLSTYYFFESAIPWSDRGLTVSTRSDTDWFVSARARLPNVTICSMPLLSIKDSLQFGLRNSCDGSLLPAIRRHVLSSLKPWIVKHEMKVARVGFGERHYPVCRRALTNVLRVFDSYWREFAYQANVSFPPVTVTFSSAHSCISSKLVIVLDTVSL